jgi:hypothetical protein
MLCVILGFHDAVNKVLALLRCYAALIGTVPYPLIRLFISENIKEDGVDKEERQNQC